MVKGKAKLSDLKQEYKIGLMLNQIALTMCCDLIASLNDSTPDEVLQIFTQKAVVQLKSFTLAQIDNLLKRIEDLTENSVNKGDVLSIHIKLDS